MSGLALIVVGTELEARAAFSEFLSELKAEANQVTLVHIDPDAMNGAAAWGIPFSLWDDSVRHEGNLGFCVDLETYVRRRVLDTAKVYFRVCLQDGWIEHPPGVTSYLAGLGWRQFALTSDGRPPQAPQEAPAPAAWDEDLLDDGEQPEDEGHPCPQCWQDPCYCDVISRYCGPGDPGFPPIRQAA